MDLSKLTMGEKIIGGAGIVLILDLLLFPWHKIDLGIVSVSRSGIESPNGFWGVLAMLVALAMVAVVVATRFTTAKVPDLPIPLGQAMFFAGIAVIALLVIKLVAETDFLGFGAYLGILLGAAMAYGGFMYRKEAGEAPAAPPMGSTGL
ncbi:MAG TPA: hypothetical protein VHM89_15935 [Acidimicrobiales bacterium]|nr:hypothetical protein [Acidimicrobiales bacterium]